MNTLRSYHFTKGFFGTNGITKKSGCTTPDANEAAVKAAAMEQCRECYVCVIIPNLIISVLLHLQILPSNSDHR